MSKRIEIEEYKDDTNEFVTRMVLYHFQLASDVVIEEESTQVIFSLFSFGKLQARMVYNNMFDTDDSITKIYGTPLLPEPLYNKTYCRWVLYRS